MIKSDHSHRLFIAFRKLIQKMLVVKRVIVNRNHRPVEFQQIVHQVAKEEENFIMKEERLIQIFQGEVVRKVDI
jgi:iron-sulfur cluster repair protein YtfE (RIC family)